MTRNDYHGPSHFPMSHHTVKVEPCAIGTDGYIIVKAMTPEEQQEALDALKKSLPPEMQSYVGMSDIGPAVFTRPQVVPLQIREYDPRPPPLVRYELKAPPTDWDDTDQEALDKFVRDRPILKLSLKPAVNGDNKIY